MSTTTDDKSRLVFVVRVDCGQFSRVRKRLGSLSNAE
jgi:hypothetical protein